MSKPLLVRGVRQLLTLQGPSGPRRGTDLRNLGIIQDGAVLIVDGLIREVGTSRRLENLSDARQADEVDATGRVVLPGFVDSNTHLVSGPARLMDYEMQMAGASLDEIERAGGGRPAILKSLEVTSGRALETEAWGVLQNCIRQGTTTVEARSGFAANESGEMRILRTHAALNERLNNIVSTFTGARLFSPEMLPDSDAYVDWLCSYMLPLIRRRRLADFVDVFCDEGMFGVEHARRLLSAAKELHFGLKVTAGQYTNIGGVKLAVELGVVSVEHAIHVDEGDIAAMARSGTIATLLPGPVFYLGLKRYSPARAMIDRGVAVALASNYNPATCPTQNMQMILSLACRKMSMTPAEAVSAATINGAHAAGRADRVGSLECGKEADLIVLAVADYREIPYHFGVNLVDIVLKRGRVIYRASEVECRSN